MNALGDDMGERAFIRGLELGRELKADELHLVRQLAELAAAGYMDGMLWRANAALQDVRAARGAEQMIRLHACLRRFARQEVVTAGDFAAAAHAAGLEPADLMRLALRQAGEQDAPTTPAMVAAFADLEQAGKITGRVVIKALLQGINERLCGGRGLGTAAQEAGASRAPLRPSLMRILVRLPMEKMATIRILVRGLDLFDEEARR